MRTYHVSIHGVGDFVHRTDESVVCVNAMILERFPDLIGLFPVRCLIITRDHTDGSIVSTLHLTMIVSLP